MHGMDICLLSIGDSPPKTFNYHHLAVGHDLLHAASPSAGGHVPDVQGFLATLQISGIVVAQTCDSSHVHAWFLELKKFNVAQKVS